MSNKQKNSAPAKEAATVEKAEAPKVETKPKFPLATLRADSYKLFGVSTSTFDGAFSEYDGEDELPIKEAGDIRKKWRSKEVK